MLRTGAMMKIRDLLRRGLGVGKCDSRMRGRRAWGVEALEGRALMSVFVVDDPGVSGKGIGLAGDLPYAIQQADQSTEDSTIVFSPTVYGRTISLGSGSLDIDKPSGTLTIVGPGGGGLTISGGGHSQVFTISPMSRVVISGLTISGGVGSEGGGIQNDGKLTLTNSMVSGNTSIGGGGGGIANGPFGVMSISESTISGNLSLLADGGGILNDGTLTVARSTISGNTARYGDGGGIGNDGTLTIVESTISGNQAVGGSGGGLNNSLSLTMTDDTVSANTAEISGGGIANQAFLSGRITINNAIVADNLSTNDPRTDDLIDNGDLGGGNLTGSHDLIGAGDLGSLTHTLVGVDPRLGPLQDNGGPTWTQAIQVGSPAVAAGDPSLVPAGDRTDQRGLAYSRVVRGRLDLGSFELQRIPRVIPNAPKPSSALPRSVGAVVGLTIVPDAQAHGSKTSANGSSTGTTAGEA